MCSAYCARRVSYVVGCYNFIATELGRCGSSCMQKLYSARAVLSLYSMLEYELCCEHFAIAA